MPRRDDPDPDVEDLLQSALTAVIAGVDLDTELEALDLPWLETPDEPVTIATAHTFDDVGILTYDRGIYLGLSDGSAFTLTITRYRNPDHETTTRHRPRHRRPSRKTGGTQPTSTTDISWLAEVTARIRCAAAAAARTDADWWTFAEYGGQQNSTTQTAAREILTGLTDGDPDIYDRLPTPARDSATDAYHDAAPTGAPRWPELPTATREHLDGQHTDAYVDALIARITRDCHLALCPRDEPATHPRPADTSASDL